MVKKSSKKTTETSKKTKSSTEQKEKSGTGEIKEASIAKFMRKRTQLVGFDYGLYKHAQYAVEFVDNALDAIEKFQWTAKNTLEDLKNKTGRFSYDFEKYEYDVNILKEKIEEGAPKSELVKRLQNLYGNINNQIENINNVEKLIYSKIALGFSNNLDDEFRLKPIEEMKITNANIDESYDNFQTIFGDIKSKYDEVNNKLNQLDSDSQFMFTLNDELFFQNFSYISSNNNTPPSEDLKTFLGPESTNSLDENNNDISDSSEILDLDENEVDIVESSSSLSEIKEQIKIEESIDDDEARELRKRKKDDKEKQEELLHLIDSLEDYVTPLLPVLDSEPLVIIKLQEEEAPEVYQEKGEKDTYMFTFEIFDNGTGMKPEDLLKYGKYLASSKSQKLKQTRGSQGFGSPSAFSDAQNTTGRSVTVVSKHSSQIFGVASEFFTTDKNTKVYVIEPTEIECLFTHGTYCKLHYLNKKYKRGYVDDYVRKNALMNSHVTMIFIDPYGEEHIFPRRVGFFPKEPKYALPHPSSIKIGDFQDLLRSSENITVTAFLTDNFVRMSNNLAKAIVAESEFEIEKSLKFLNLDGVFLSVIGSKSENFTFAREEDRVYGKTKKPRPKLIVYNISSGDLHDKLWAIMDEYNTSLKYRKTLENKIKSIDKDIQKETDKKAIKALDKDISNNEKIISKEIKRMEEAEKKLAKLLQSANLIDEIDDIKTVDKISEIVQELRISKTKPSKLTQLQIEYLYMAFKNQKYMAPPTDTAIPVGETTLETALIKHFNLTVSNRIDYFGNPEDEIRKMGEYETQKIKSLLTKFNDENLKNPEYNFDDIYDHNKEINNDVYSKLILEMDLERTHKDDFIAAHTRKPTSGKGLAFVVEAAMAYSPDSSKIPPSRTAAQVVSRYVNRTPKLRDNSDCALWLGIQNVKWKSYKVDATFDNGIPRGNYAIYINCSGPYTHLMFKSQSKNALAEDEALLKEVKYCLEVIGRKLRKYLSKKEIRQQRSDRAKKIKKNLPLFVKSLYKVAVNNPKYAKLKEEYLKEKLQETLDSQMDSSGRKTGEVSESDANIQDMAAIQFKKPEKLISNQPEVEHDTTKIVLTSAHSTTEKKITSQPVSTKTTTVKPKELPIKKDARPATKVPSQADQSGARKQMMVVDTDSILEVLSDGKWYTTSQIVKKMKITNMMDAKFLQLKLKGMYGKGLLNLGMNKEKKKVWKLKNSNA